MNEKCPDTRYLVFAASLRQDSLNAKLAKLAARLLQGNGGVVDLATFDAFDCPSYDGDDEAADGIPSGAQEFRRRLSEADALVIASPEYNASVPGCLKNMIDWASRFRPQPFMGKQALLLSASPSMVGGNRGLWSLRVPLEHLGTRVYPDMFSLAKAHEMFDAEGNIAVETVQNQLEGTLQCFMELTEAAKNYPALRTQWIEFLGEQPDPATMRVES